MLCDPGWDCRSSATPLAGRHVLALRNASVVFEHAGTVRKTIGPARTAITGFPFYDKPEPGEGLSPDLARFPRCGTGARRVYSGLVGCFRCGRILLRKPRGRAQDWMPRGAADWPGPANMPEIPVPDAVFVAEYAPYSAAASACGGDGAPGRNRNHGTGAAGRQADDRGAIQSRPAGQWDAGQRLGRRPGDSARPLSREIGWHGN